MVLCSNTAPTLANYHFEANKQSMPTPPPVSAGGPKLERLRKLWVRRFKPIIAAGSNPISASKIHRRRTVFTDMIGYPQDFTHSNHMGVDEATHVEPHLRYSNDVPHIGLYGSSKWPPLSRLPECDVGVALDITHQNHAIPILGASYNARHSVCPALNPAIPTARKVKRKSVPIDVLQELADSSPRDGETVQAFEKNRRPFSRISIEESLLQLINYEQPPTFAGHPV